MDFIAPMSVLITTVLTIGWIVRTVTHQRRLKEVARLQAELNTKLIEKFGTAQEMLQYLESDAGRQLVDSTTLERANPYARILGSVQTGILVFFAGIALLAVRSSIPGSAANGFGVLGAFGLILGLGFLGSAAASYVLSKSWGLIQGPAENPTEE